MQGEAGALGERPAEAGTGEAEGGGLRKGGDLRGVTNRAISAPMP